MPTLSPSSEDVRVYEVAVMLQPDLDQKSENALLAEIDGLFKEADAKLLFKDPWTKRGLAYKIGGYSEAKFVIYYYEMDPSKLRELDRMLRLTKGVLRHLITLPPDGYEAVSFESAYQDWMKTRETAADMKKRKSEEKLKSAVTAQAKRATKRMDAKAKPKKKAEPLEMSELTESLDKLISDDDLKL